MRWMLLATTLVACPGPARPPAPAVPPEPAMRVSFDPDPSEPGLQLELSEAGAVQTPGDATSQAQTQPLAEPVLSSLLDRLPPIQAEETADFARRADSLPPPRAGETVPLPFPPPAQATLPDPDADGPLRVLRLAPEGDVPAAPHFSISFSQPMVALSSQDHAAQTLPVELSPTVPGAWRWIGTRTLLFQPDGQFPKATTYTVRVPADVHSATGGALATPFESSFTMPPPRLLGGLPQGTGVVREPVLVLPFDQQIDPQAMLPFVHLRAGRDDLRLRLATAAEIEADPTAKAALRDATPGRWLALRPTEALPYDTLLRVHITPGAPSAEGPLTTTVAQQYSFRTFGAFTVTEHTCGWRKRCAPRDEWKLRLSNPIDAEAFDLEQVHIEPSVDTESIYVSGPYLHILPHSATQTRYTVRLDDTLLDVHGQPLTGERSFEFKVGDAEPAPPWLSDISLPTVILDPDRAPTLPIYSTNIEALRVRAWRVSGEDWARYHTWMRRREGTPPGELAMDQVVPVAMVQDQAVETALPLDAALSDGLGQLIVMIEPEHQRKDRERRTVVWVQSTRIGLDAFSDAGQLYGWATDLSTGAPLPATTLSLGDTRATTDAGGLAHLALADDAPGTQVLIAKNGDDVALLVEDNYWWSDDSAWTRTHQADDLRWFVFDDRQMYRPGEDVRVKGWLRLQEAGPGGDIQPATIEQIAWTLVDSRRNELHSGTATVDAHGGFDLSIPLPDTMNLGDSEIRLQARSAGSLSHKDTTHQFQVQEFRRPEFEVSAEVEAGPHVLGQTAVATVHAAYYAGGALPSAPTDWRLTAHATSYRPPNWDEFRFGTQLPWWCGWLRPQDEDPERSWSYRGTTDVTGAQHLALHFAALRSARPMQIEAEATVQDVNRQAWTATTSLLLHPSQVYLGLQPDRPFYRTGQKIQVSTVAVDIDGHPVSGLPVTVDLVQMQWKRQKDGTWEEREASRQSCTLTSTDQPQACRFAPDAGGRFELQATVTDRQGRPNQTRTPLWVAGGEPRVERRVSEQEALLIPDQERYQPGDTAEILLQSPFSPAEALVRWERSGVIHTETLHLDQPSATLRVPIEDAHTPNLHVTVDLAGSAPRGDDPTSTRPAYATGSIDLPVPPLQRTLSVQATPREAALEPGGATTIDVSVRDADEQPVAGAQVAVIVVDESVLALTGYKVPDPIEVIYTSRPTGVTRDRARRWLVLADTALPPDTGTVEEPMMEMEGAMPPPMMRTMAAEAPSPDMVDATMDNAAPQGGATSAIVMRTDFSATALFAPTVETDARGQAAVPLKLPDNLTRYRIVAVAVSGAQRFGKGESSITARRPLMLRPSAPRFLNFGDDLELPLIVQNQTSAPLPVNLALRGTNITLSGAPQAGLSFTVPPNDRVEVRVPAATVSAGTARFQAVVSTPDGATTDATSFELPVWTPATTEAFATYGTMAGDQQVLRQPVAPPEDVWPQFGGLQVTTSSTQLQTLTDAVLYLVHYPYDCAEQISSRVLAIAALRDVLGAFEAEGLPTPDALQASVATDLQTLARRQNSDGGWGFWRAGEASWPYLSVHVTHALVRARDKGFQVPEPTLRRGLRYLQRIERHIPAEYGEDARRSITAYALYVRDLAGDTDTGAAHALLSQAGADELPLEALGWLLPSLDSADRARALRVVHNHVTETAGGAHFVTSYGDQGYLLLHSDRRVDGVLLEALLTIGADDELLPKIVRGLQDHRVAGHWASTQDNAFVLLALDRYFHTFEGTEPDFVARTWLGEQYAGDHLFQGRTTERATIDVPMQWLADRGEQDLLLSREGQGRLYYRLGLRYAPKDLDLAPADHGFAVERRYEGVDDPADVRQDDDGTWHIRAGSLVRVRLSMVATARRTHVALVDPLPAGLEVLNPELDVMGSMPGDDQAQPDLGGRFWWWWRPWYDHENLRDERIEAFANLVWDGVHPYSYVARATTPGHFVVPPTKAEEMYHPEVFGRSGTDRVIIEDQ